MKNSFYLLLFLITFSPLKAVYAQTRSSQDSVGIKRLSQDLKIGVTLAVQVINAMQSNQARIDSLIKDRNIKPAQKRLLFIQLTSEREKRIADLLTEDQFIRFRKLMLNNLQPSRTIKSAEIALMKANESGARSKPTN
jgi:hypothetical protein